jgi:Predicted membrane protein
MKTIQQSLLAYAESNKYLSPLLKISFILAIIYPLFLVLSKITLLNIVWNFIWMFGAVLYIAYIIGVILCFAKNQLIPLDIAFVCMAFSELYLLRYGMTLNQLIYIAFYSAIAAVCIVATRKTNQWNQFMNHGINKAESLIKTESAVSSDNRIKKHTFCPNCGNELMDDAKFCNSCGQQLTNSHQ